MMQGVPINFSTLFLFPGPPIVLHFYLDKCLMSKENSSTAFLLHYHPFKITRRRWSEMERIKHYFNFYYITCRAVNAFLFNWVERFRRQTSHSHHTWSNENVTRLYYSHVAADASGEWIHVEFVSLDSSRLQTRQWRKQWVTRRGFYLLWRFLALSETKWWYSSSTRVFVFSWRVKSHH